MSIVRVKERAPGSFFIADKQYLWEFKMKMSARGLLTVLVGLPDDWIVSVSWFAKNYVEGRDAFHTMFRELQKFGYIEKKEYRNKRGEIRSVDYIVYERADLNRAFDPSAEKPYPVDARIIKNNYYQNNNCSLEAESKNNEHQLDLFAESSQETPAYSAAEPDKPIEELVATEPAVDKIALVKTLFASKVELFPCHDAIPKRSSMLKHCLKQVRQVETLIGALLTPAQEAVVTDVADYFSIKGSETELSVWITEALLSRHAFDQCKTFVHKINAIICKIRIGAFTRPRRFDMSAKRIWPAKNAMAAAHSFVSKHVNAETTTDTRSRTLKEKKRILLQQLSSAKSAEIQFKNYPAIAEKHTISITEYQKSLRDIDTEMQRLIQPGTDPSPRSCHA